MKLVLWNLAHGHLLKCYLLNCEIWDSRVLVQQYILLWAHGLHLLFFPVWPVYSIDVCLDRVTLDSQQNCVFLKGVYV